MITAATMRPPIMRAILLTQRIMFLSYLRESKPKRHANAWRSVSQRMLCSTTGKSAIFYNRKTTMGKVAIAILCVLAAGCGAGGTAPQALSADDAAYQQKLQELFLDATPGSVIA